MLRGFVEVKGVHALESHTGTRAGGLQSCRDPSLGVARFANGSTASG